MKVATIIVPQLPQRGTQADVLLLESRLLNTFGGFTRSEAKGAWRDPEGKDHVEKVFVYQIANNWTAPACHQLLTIARWAATEMGEQCVYIETPLGGVEFVKPEPVRAVA